MTRRTYDIKELLMDLNCMYHGHEEIVDLFSRIIEKPVNPTFGLSLPSILSSA